MRSTAQIIRANLAASATTTVFTWARIIRPRSHLPSGGAIFWSDETGLRSDDVRGRGYVPPGRTPEVRVNHKRANLGLISAVTSKDELRWMVLDGAIKAPDLIRFLARLVRDAEQKVFLILDRLPVHRSAKVRDWLVGREAKIEVLFLPGYSPEPSGQCPEAGRGGQR